METLPKVLSKPNSKKSHTNPTHSNPLSITTSLPSKTKKHVLILTIQFSLTYGKQQTDYNSMTQLYRQLSP